MADASDLTCQELVEIITEYLEGAMPDTDRQRFEGHLRECDGCVTYLEQMRTTIRLMGTLTEEAVDSKAKDRLLALFRDWHRR